jgi:hypothetical protein
MNVDEQTPKLDGPDRQLVDLVAAALVDPNLHTDARMRLAGELTALVDGAHRDLYGSAINEANMQAEDGELAKMLAAVLVDPNLHTDLQMRLHEQIPELIRSAQRDATAHA